MFRRYTILLLRDVPRPKMDMGHLQRAMQCHLHVVVDNDIHIYIHRITIGRIVLDYSITKCRVYYFHRQVEI